MAKTDPNVEAYLEKTQPFAKPILHHLRQLVHDTVPDVEESIKWNFPNFTYKGGIVCSIAGFKDHCSLGFIKEKMMSDPDGLFAKGEREGMGSLGQIKNLKDLPSDNILKKYILEALRLVQEGVPSRPPKPKVPAGQPIAVPEDFVGLLDQSKAAKEVFGAFSYSAKKEYLDWFAEAKTEPTRQKRMEQALEWIAEGKQRNWKYMK